MTNGANQFELYRSTTETHADSAGAGFAELADEARQLLQVRAALPPPVLDQTQPLTFAPGDQVALRVIPRGEAAVAQSPAVLRYAETNDGRGHQVRIGSQGGTNVFCSDGTGEWDSTDGRRWVRKDSGGTRIWHGDIRIDANGDYITHNGDAGVTSTRRPDGTTVISVTSAGGQQIEIGTNAQGTNVSCTDSTGRWTSTDGQHWTNTGTGARSSSTVRLDEFGQYLVRYEGQAERVERRSGELNSNLERQRRLSAQFGIEFTAPGERVKPYETEYSTRPPTTEELDCLEQVLTRNRQMNLQGLRFGFIQPNADTDNSGLWGNYSHTGNNGRPEILLFPMCGQQTMGWSALEGTLQHELVHYEQYHNWGTGHWGNSSPAEARQLMQDLGWVFDQTSQRYRMLDRNNQQWEYDKDRARWDPLIDGHLNTGRSVTSEQMRELARVRPATNYFNAPWEMHAEALAMFRYNRNQLRDQNAALCDLMQHYDQREIDRRFGTEDGQPRLIRGAGGEIVPNTPQQRREADRPQQSSITPEPQLERQCYCCQNCQARS